MIRTYKELALRYMKKQKRRTILNVLAVIMSSLLITGTGTIVESGKAQMISNALKREGHYHVAFKNVTERQANIIKGHMDVEDSCAGKIDGFAVLSETGDKDIPYRLLRIGISNSKAMSMLKYDQMLKAGRLPQKAGEIALDETSMKILGADVSVGSRITLAYGQRKRLSNDSILTDYLYPLSLDEDEADPEEYFQETGERTYTITGILTEYLFISKNYSSNGLTWGEPSHFSSGGDVNLLVQLKDLTDVRKTAETIAEDVGLEKSNIVYNTHLLNVSGKSLSSGVRDAMTGFTVIITAIIVAATIAVIYNSFNIALIERINQMGILRCVGSTPSQIRNLILREAGFICAIAIPIGTILGLLSMKLVFMIADALSSYIMFEGIEVVVSPSVIITSILICAATVFFAALVPAWKAGSIPPIEAVRSTGMYIHDRIRPPVFSSFFGFSPGFIPLMAYRNMGRNRKRFLVTLFSMVISVVLFVSFGGMLRLIKSTYVIDMSPMPGIKVESENVDFSDEIIAKIEETHGVDLVIPYGTEKISLIVDESKLSSYYKQYVNGLENFSRIGPNIIIPNCRIICYGDKALHEMSRKFGFDSTAERIIVRKSQFLDDSGKKAYAPNSSVEIGDTLHVHYDEKNFPLVIDAGMDDVYYKDFNQNEEGIDIVVNESEYLRLTAGRGFEQLFIRMEPKADKKELKEYLDELTEGKIGYSYVDVVAQAEEMAGETQAISLFFYGFIIVIALISSLNIINTISTNLLVRSREFGIIRAVGLYRQGLRKLVLMESLVYSVLSLVFGGLIGTGIWYLLVRRMSNFRITVFSAPWSEIAISAVALAVVVFFSGYFPLKRIHNQAIVDNIRGEE